MASLPWNRLLPVVGLLSLAGCMQGKDLDRRIESAERKVAALEQDVAEKDALAERVKQQQIQEARLSQQLSAPTPEALEAAFAPLPGMRVVTEQSESAIVTGRTNLADFALRLEELGKAQPGVQVHKLSLDGDALEVELGVLYPEDPPPPPSQAPIGSVFPWNQAKRDRLAQLEARRAELASQLPDAVNQRSALQWRVNALQDLARRAQTSRRTMIELAQRLTMPKVVVAPLELTWRSEDETIIAAGRPLDGNGPASLQAALGATFSADDVGMNAGWVRATVRAVAPTLGTDTAGPAAEGTP